MQFNGLQSSVWIVLDRQKFDGGGRSLRQIEKPGQPRCPGFCLFRARFCRGRALTWQGRAAWPCHAGERALARVRTMRSQPVELSADASSSAVTPDGLRGEAGPLRISMRGLASSSSRCSDSVMCLSAGLPGLNASPHHAHEAKSAKHRLVSSDKNRTTPTTHRPASWENSE